MPTEAEMEKVASAFKRDPRPRMPTDLRKARREELKPHLDKRMVAVNRINTESREAIARIKEQAAAELTKVHEEYHAAKAPIWAKYDKLAKERADEAATV
jgi:hypothetical protein